MQVLGMQFLEAVKVAAPPAYRYDDRLSRYRDAKTGRFVAWRVVLDLVDASGLFGDETLAGLSEVLRMHDFSLTSWFLAAHRVLIRLHAQNAALGAGGFDRLKPADFARMGKMIRDDEPRLLQFGREIEGGLLSPAQIQNRVHMYTGHARVNFYRARRLPRLKAGEVILDRRRLNPAEHCFPAGTMIQTPSGERPIETLKIGDWVTTRRGPRRVTQLFEKQADDLWRVQAGNRMVVTTGNHPFLTRDGWRRVDELRSSDDVVLYQDGAYRFERHVTLPNSSDLVATGDQVSVTRTVPNLLFDLRLAKRIEPRVAVPPISVGFNDQRSDTYVNQEGLFDLYLLLKRYAKIIQDDPQAALQLAGFGLLVGDPSPEQIALERVDVRERALAHGFAKLLATLCAGIRRYRGIVNQTAVGFWRQVDAYLAGVLSDFAGGLADSLRAPFRAMIRIEPAQVFVLGGGPDMPSGAMTAQGHAFSFANWLAATFTEGHDAGRAAIRALGGLALLDLTARAEIPSLLAGPAERPLALSPASYATHIECILPQGMAVYNIEVEDVHEYIANGFVVHNCSYCLHLASLGWQPVGTLPMPGESDPSWDGDQCLTNCRCDLERRVFTVAEAQMMVGKALAVNFDAAWEDSKAFTESLHPRHPAGTAVDAGTGIGGGRFAPKDGDATTDGEGLAPQPATFTPGTGSTAERWQQVMNHMMSGELVFTAGYYSDRWERLDADAQSRLVDAMEKYFVSPEPPQTVVKAPGVSVVFDGMAGVQAQTIDYARMPFDLERDFSFPREELADLFATAGFDVKVHVTPDYYDTPSQQTKLFIGATLYDLDTGALQGDIGLSFNTARTDDSPRHISLGLMQLPIKQQGRGIGQDFLEKLAAFGEKHGYKQISLVADITIGRYAWAKMGFDYTQPEQIERTTRRFRQWAERRDIAEPAGGWPTFTSVMDVATYDAPGVTVDARKIDNRDVHPLTSLPMGKAFMLDQSEDGHGSWLATMQLGDAKKSIESWALSSGDDAWVDETAYPITEFDPSIHMLAVCPPSQVPDGASDIEFWQEWLDEDDASTKAFDPALHPRYPAGTAVDATTGAGGGRFAPKILAGAVDAPDVADANALNGLWVWLGSAVNLADYGVTPKWINSIFKVNRGMRVEGEITVYEGKLSVGAKMFKPQHAVESAAFWVHLSPNRYDMYYELAWVRQHTVDYDLDGFGMEFTRNLFDQARAIGVRRIKLFADITIGRYAWAKMGFDYVNPDEWLRKVRENLPAWMAKVGIERPAEMPDFQSAHDVATYDIPGVRVSGRKISNLAVPQNMEMPVGKAFMLDQGSNGHGEWDGVLMLDAASKAVIGLTLPQDAGTGILLWPSGEPLPLDADDSQFWQEWLDEDDASTKAFTESLHPRHPAGTAVDASSGVGGGRFSPKEGGEVSPDSVPTGATAPTVTEERLTYLRTIFSEPGVVSTALQQAHRLRENKQRSLDEAMRRIRDLEPGDEKRVVAENLLTRIQGQLADLETKVVEFEALSAYYGVHAETPAPTRVSDLEELVGAWKWGASDADFSEYGVTTDWVNDVFKVNRGLQITGTASEYEDSLFITSRLYGESTDKPLAYFDFRVGKDKVLHYEMAAVDQADPRLEGFGLEFTRNLFDQARAIGMKEVRLFADITIGRYSWARIGFDYTYPKKAGEMSVKMQTWLDKRGFSIPQPVPVFGSAQEVAAFDVPGVRIRGDQIANADVPPDMELTVGKAFMLDKSDSGHGSWDGVLALDATTKAATALDMALDAASGTPRDDLAVLLWPNEETLPDGASDYSPWADWLAADTPGAVSKAFDEAKIKRHPKGTAVDTGTGVGGGRFAPKGETGGGSDDGVDKGVDRVDDGDDDEVDKGVDDEKGEESGDKVKKQDAPEQQDLILMMTQAEPAAVQPDAAPSGWGEVEPAAVPFVETQFSVRQENSPRVEGQPQFQTAAETRVALLSEWDGFEPHIYNARVKLNAAVSAHKAIEARLADVSLPDGDRAALEEQAWDLAEEVFVGDGEVRGMMETYRRRVTPYLLSGDPLPLAWKPLSPLSDELQNSVEIAIDAVSKYADKDIWADVASKPVLVMQGSTSSTDYPVAFYDQHGDEGIIFIPEGEKASTVVHELGHYLEHRIPGLHEKAVRFVESRTQGEVPREMHNITGQDRHQGILVQSDKFMDPYTGRVYGTVGNRRATEVISTGLEYLAREPHELARRDPQLFDFILDVLRGH